MSETKTKEEIRELFRRRGADAGQFMQPHGAPAADTQELNDIYIEAFYEVVRAMPSYDIHDILVPIKDGDKYSTYRLSMTVGVELSDEDVDWRWEVRVVPAECMKERVTNAQCLYGIQDLSMSLTSEVSLCRDLRPDCCLLLLRLDPICRDRRLAFVTKESIVRFFKEHGERNKQYGRSKKEIEIAKRGVLDNVARMPAEGDRLILPRDAVFKNYAAVKAVMEKAGGKYLKNAFVFAGKDAQEIKDRLLSGEKLNDKKKFQQFYTPDALVDMMHAKSDIHTDDLILEPSAGRGALLKGIEHRNVHVCEMDDDNRAHLEKEGYAIMANDFLEYEPGPHYDVVLANPPFTNNQDVKHVRHMYEVLKKGGTLVSIMSTSWKTGQQRLQQEFREWLEEVEADVEDIPEGMFKESGTGIATTMVTIVK